MSALQIVTNHKFFLSKNVCGQCRGELSAVEHDRANHEYKISCKVCGPHAGTIKRTTAHIRTGNERIAEIEVKAALTDAGIILPGINDKPKKSAAALIAELGF